MWVYIERLEAGTWVNSGSVNMAPEFLKEFKARDQVSKMAISEPMRSYLKKSLLTPHVCVVIDPDDLPEVPGLILDTSMVYRFVFLIHKGG